MIAVLLILGAVWVGFSAVFLIALCCAAKKPMPSEQAEPMTLKHAA